MPSVMNASADRFWIIRPGRGSSKKLEIARLLNVLSTPLDGGQEMSNQVQHPKSAYAQVYEYEWRRKLKPLIEECGHESALLYLYLRSCGHRNMSGIYYLPITTIVHELMIDSDTVSFLLEKFQEKQLCFYDLQTEEVFVVDMLETQIGDELKASDKRSKMVMRHFFELDSSILREMFEERFWGRYLHDADSLRGFQGG